MQTIGFRLPFSGRDLSIGFVLVLTMLEFSILVFQRAPHTVLKHEYAARRNLLERPDESFPSGAPVSGGGVAVQELKEALQETVVSLRREMKELKLAASPAAAPLPQAGTASLISWEEGAPCQQQTLGALEGNMPWEAAENKYLIAGCHIGGFSNRLVCLFRSMNLAVALKRTLVIAPWKQLEESSGGDNAVVNLDPADVLDLRLANYCTGEAQILSWAEFQQLNQGLTVQGLCVYHEPEKHRCVGGMQLGKDMLQADFGAVDVLGADVSDVQAAFNFSADILWVSVNALCGLV